MTKGTNELIRTVAYDFGTVRVHLTDAVVLTRIRETEVIDLTKITCKLRVTLTKKFCVIGCSDAQAFILTWI